METFKCCLCGAETEGFGHNPQPLSQNHRDRCCDLCNTMKVVPERLSRAARGLPMRGPYDWPISKPKT